MGAGFYLIWPAFYTDVTDSYRLGRGGRLRTDLGGLHFNAIVAVATAGLWWLTRNDAVLLVVATQLLQMLRQLLPLVRFDGYHVLADLTGVPDLFARIGPTLASLVPGRKDPRAAALKPWARAVVTAWTLTVVPLLLAALVLLVLALPRIIGTAWASAGAQWADAGTGWADGDLATAAGRALGALVVLLPVAAFGYLFTRLIRQVGVGTWRRTRGRPVRRALAAATALAVVAGLLWAWWPDEDRYRPIRPWERGTVTDAVNAVLPLGGAGGVDVGSRGRGTVLLPVGATVPSEEAPQLAVVLVPRESGGAAPVDQPQVAAGETATGDEVAGQPWIFPFDEPLAPEEGDNQALAVNTQDGTVVYDVAFALVWAEGDEPRTNTNESFAAASCTDCAAVAVAFQVVLVVGETDTAVPQNTSVAVNYECTSCLTFSLAVQLFVTLADEPSDVTRAEVERLWEEITAFGADVSGVPLSELQARLSDYERQLLEVLAAQLGLLPDGAMAPDEVTPSTEPGGASTTADPSGSPEAEPGEPSATTGSSPTSGTTSDPADEPTDGSGPTPVPTSPTSPTSSSPSPTSSSSPSPTSSPSADASP